MKQILMFVLHAFFSLGLPTWLDNPKSNISSAVRPTDTLFPYAKHKMKVCNFDGRCQWCSQTLHRLHLEHSSLAAMDMLEVSQ